MFGLGLLWKFFGFGTPVEDETIPAKSTHAIKRKHQKDKFNSLKNEQKKVKKTPASRFITDNKHKLMARKVVEKFKAGNSEEKEIFVSASINIINYYSLLVPFMEYHESTSDIAPPNFEEEIAIPFNDTGYETFWSTLCNSELLDPEDLIYFKKAKKESQSDEREFRRSTIVYRDALPFQRIVLVDEEREENKDEYDGILAFDATDKSLSLEEHMNRLGRIEGDCPTWTSDRKGISISAGFLPRKPLDEIILEMKELLETNPEVLNLRHQIDDADPYPFINTESNSSTDASTSPASATRRMPEPVIIDIIASRRVAMLPENQHLHYLNNPGHNQNKLVTKPINTNTAPEGLILHYRIDMAGHSKWKGIKKRMAAQVIRTCKARKEWIRKGISRLHAGIAAGALERPDQRGNAGFYRNHRNRNDSLAIIQNKLEVNIINRSIKKLKKVEVAENFKKKKLSRTTTTTTRSKIKELECKKQKKLLERKVLKGLNNSKLRKEEYDELLRAEIYTGDQSAAVTKALFPIKFAAEIADTLVSGLMTLGVARRSSWLGSVINYDSRQHREAKGTETLWSIGFALGFIKRKNQEGLVIPDPAASSLIYSRLGNGIVVEGGDGCISGWRAEKETHGTGRIAEGGIPMVSDRMINQDDPDEVLRLRGGAQEVGSCETRKLNAAGNARRVRREVIARIGAGRARIPIVAWPQRFVVRP